MYALGGGVLSFKHHLHRAESDVFFVVSLMSFLYNKLLMYLDIR